MLEIIATAEAPADFFRDGVASGPGVGASVMLTWGDTGRVDDRAAEEFRPGETGAAVGFREADEGIVVIVEFGDGSSVEMPATWLERVDE